MNRRKAVQQTSALLGLTLIGAQAFLSGCDLKETGDKLFSNDQINLLNDLGEVILPKTNRSPGAREAGVGEFMERFVRHCYSLPDQNVFTEGLSRLQSSGFAQMTTTQRVAFVENLENEWATAGDPHYYGMIKQLTILGFFSSEAGVTRALRYNPLPGGYNGCVPYTAGDKAWQGPLSSIG